MIIGLNLRDKTIKDEPQQAKVQVFSSRFSSQSTGLLQTLLAAEIAVTFFGLRVRDDHPIAPTTLLNDEVWAAGTLYSREIYPSTFLDWKKRFVRNL